MSLSVADEALPRQPQRVDGLQFLKLGGSLITEKLRPRTPRLEVLARLAQEIAVACQGEPGGELILGHGSGSFGHVAAARYGTRQGVHTPQEWQGFIEVWRDAASLHRLVVDALGQAGLPAVSFPPSACVTAGDGKVLEWNLAPLQAALQAGLLPVVYGDVAFDRQRGGTILSTEDLFEYLAQALRPQRILLAGLEKGVWADYPANTHLLAALTPAGLEQAAIGASAAVDVTGGMRSKVAQSLRLVQQIPGLQVVIFSGEIPGTLQKALLGEAVGTSIHRD
ncbi:MAG: isopentenyl phosphate kinase [Chloroflexota bacterium]